MRPRCIGVSSCKHVGEKDCLAMRMISPCISLWRAMTIPPLLQLSEWRTERFHKKQLHFFWRLGGLTLKWAQKNREIMLCQVVPCTLSQEPVCLARRKGVSKRHLGRWQFPGFLRHSWHPYFFSSFLSSLTARMCSAVENPSFLWLHQSSCNSHIENCCISNLMMSQVYVGPAWTYLQEMYLKLLQLEGWFSIFQRKDEGTSFHRKLFQPSERLSCIFRHVLQKDLLWLDHTDLQGVPLLRIFLRRFCDLTDVSLPFLSLLFEPIVFGFFILDITSKKRCAHAHLKPVTLAK